MRICPRCRREYPTAARRCEADGVPLVDAGEFEASGRDPLLGVTLGARYTLTGRIGVGGMGTVYRAEQSPVGREVAVKVLRRELSDDPETVPRFKREAHTLSQLRHPNPVTIFDAARTDDGLLYLAMERQLTLGGTPQVEVDRDKPCVIALREIVAGKVGEEMLLRAAQ